MTTQPEVKDRLVEELLITLEEAASRGSPDDAAVVIAGTLANISDHRSGLRQLAEQWAVMIDKASHKE